MPEGDTIHGLANRLSDALVGRRIVEVWARSVALEQALAGQRAVAVTAVGKHLLVRWEDGQVLHVHLGLSGRWRVGVERALGGFDGDRTALALRVPGATHRLDRPMLLRRMPAEHLAADRILARLGPDLARPDVPLDDVLANAAHAGHRGRAATDVLLDQSIAAGIGNVYKCELLFLHRMAPLRPWEAVSYDVRHAVYADAARLIRLNIGAPERRTRSTGPPLWVYGGRMPCLQCGGRVRRDRLGTPHVRVTYWCPSCQV